MERCLDWALGNHVFVGLALGDEGIPLGKLAKGGVGTEAPATLKGFNHATDTTIPVSPVGFDIVWPWAIAICGIIKGFKGTGGRVGGIGEEIVIGVMLGGRTPNLALEDVAAETPRRCKERILPKFVHPHSAKGTLERGHYGADYPRD
jgi:hypothetical protein